MAKKKCTCTPRTAPGPEDGQDKPAVTGLELDPDCGFHFPQADADILGGDLP